MKQITFILLLLAQVGIAQSSTSKIIDKIEFEGDTVKAVFDWVTDNIRYDVGKLNNIKKGKKPFKKGKYKNAEEYNQARLEKVIRSKKGVCEDYSLLFHELLTELGYKSFIVTGLSKKKGKVDKTGHAWNAVFVDGSWKLYDATWGAGYVKEGKRFVKKYFPRWYETDPIVMLESHFPYDPIWQLTENPMTYDDFEKGNIPSDGETPFDFDGLIAEYLDQDKKEQLSGELGRIEIYGGNVKLIRERKQRLEGMINSRDLSTIMEKIKDSNKKFTEYYAEGRNKRFKGDVWTVDYSKTILTQIKENLEVAIVEFGNTKSKSSKVNRSYKKNASNSKKMLSRVEKELKYLESL